MTWRTLIPELLSAGSFRTQGELVRALVERGHRVDQAAVSRELKVLGAVKVDGEYRLPSPTFGHPIHKFAPTARDCMVVVVTEPAWAMALAQEIDNAEIEGVLGTVAGDDTVFVATTGTPATERLASWLGVARAARRPAGEQRPRARRTSARR
jgi:transcriptional regulator of arginine metabolism